MYYYPLIVHILTLCHNRGIYLIIRRTSLLPVFIAVIKHRVTYNLFKLAITFKFVVAKVLPHSWKHDNKWATNFFKL